MTTTRKCLALLILIMVVAVSLRTYGLGALVPFYDEALTLLHVSGCTIARSLANEQQAGLTAPSTWEQQLSRYQRPAKSFNDVTLAVLKDQPEHPPLFYQIVFLWAKAFGEELYVLRAVPVIFGVLSLPAFYWLALELFRSPYPALLATAMLSLSPLHICFSQDLRDYSLFSLVLSLSSAAFLRAWRRNRLQDWGLYAAVSVLGVYSTYLMIIVLAGQLLFSTSVAALKWLKDGNFVRAAATKWVTHIIVLGTTLALCSPLLLPVVSRLEAVRRTVDWSEKMCEPYILVNTLLFPPVLCWTFRPTFFIFKDSDLVALNQHLWIHVPLLLLVLYSMFRMRASHLWQCGFLCSIFAAFFVVFWIPDFILGGQRSTAVRFLLPVPMFALLPVALMLCQWWQAGKRMRIVSGLVVVSLLACQIQAILFLLGSNEHALGRCPLTKLSKAINEDRRAVVLADLESNKLGFPHVLALAHSIDDKSRHVAFVKDIIPDWVLRAYVVYYPSAGDKKYSRFNVQPASPHNIHCHCVLISTSPTRQPKVEILDAPEKSLKARPEEWQKIAYWWLKID